MNFTLAQAAQSLVALLPTGFWIASAVIFLGWAIIVTIIALAKDNGKFPKLRVIALILVAAAPAVIPIVGLLADVVVGIFTFILSAGAKLFG